MKIKNVMPYGMCSCLALTGCTPLCAVQQAVGMPVFTLADALYIALEMIVVAYVAYAVTRKPSRRKPIMAE